MYGVMPGPSIHGVRASQLPLLSPTKRASMIEFVRITGLMVTHGRSVGMVVLDQLHRIDQSGEPRHHTNGANPSRVLEVGSKLCDFA